MMRPVSSIQSRLETSVPDVLRHDRRPRPRLRTRVPRQPALGVAPAELLEATHRLGGDELVLGMDLTGVDANADVAGITLRTMAGAFLSFAAGLAIRLGQAGR